MLSGQPEGPPEVGPDAPARPGVGPGGKCPRERVEEPAESADRPWLGSGDGGNGVGPRRNGDGEQNPRALGREGVGDDDAAPEDAGACDDEVGAEPEGLGDQATCGRRRDHEPDPVTQAHGVRRGSHRRPPQFEVRGGT